MKPPLTITDSDARRRPMLVSIDWLSISCRVTAQFFSESPLQPTGYKVERYGNGTKEWQNIARVYEPDGTLLGTLTWKPRSAARPDSSAILQIDNTIFYEAEYWDRAVAAVLGLGLEYRGINRIDIACDFNEFYNGLKAQTLINGALTRKYLKCGLARAYGSIDFGYHVNDKNGIVQCYDRQLTEHEENYIGQLRALAMKPKKLPEVTTPSATEDALMATIADIYRQKETDTYKRIEHAAAVIRAYDTAMPINFCLYAYVCSRNAEIDNTGLTPMQYRPLKLTSRPAPPTIDSLTFGRSGRNIQAIIYNKTRELKEVKMKSYIVDNWLRAGLDIKRDVWRVELRIRGKGTELVDLETEDEIKLSMTDLISKSQLETIFQAYAEKYFKWYRVDDHKKMQNMPRLPLLSFTGAPVIRPKHHHRVRIANRYVRNVVGTLGKMQAAAEEHGSRLQAYVLRRARDYMSELYEVGSVAEDAYIRKVYDDGKLYRRETPEEHVQHTESIISERAEIQAHIDRAKHRAIHQYREMKQAGTWEQYQRDLEAEICDILQKAKAEAEARRQAGKAEAPMPYNWDSPEELVSMCLLGAQSYDYEAEFARNARAIFEPSYNLVPCTF